MDTNGVYTLSVYQSVFTGHKFGQALRNSFEIAALSAAVATLIAFVLAYTCYYTNLPAKGKSIIRIAAMFPCLCQRSRMDSPLFIPLVIMDC